ncbi:MAG: WYL domain-containing protein [Bacillota bacterium]|jgi:predicted DNA-binding transcriptional regulator YafY|nr:WYL domain-containing protein [Bacillota bacterium]HHU43274.1 WYL domain-containing protein [Clostridiales bacterium]
MGSTRKIKAVKILEILKKYSDEDNPLSTNQIIERLASEGIKAERKAIYDDIKLLNKGGYEIMCRREKSNLYYVMDRSFQMPELKILLDAVQAATFVTEKKTKELVKKIADLAGENKAKLLKENIVCFNTLKHSNEYIYYNVDTIDRCILNKKKVSFLYFDYGLDCQKIYRKDKERYIVNPIALIFSEDNYYLIAYIDKYDDICHFRVDRMEKVEEEKEDIVVSESIKGFNIHKHKKEVFFMFKGELTRVKILAHNEIINVIVDKFGEKVRMQKHDDDHVVITADVQISPTFYAWCFTFGSKLKILSPEKVIDELKRRALEAVKTYS